METNQRRCPGFCMDISLSVVRIVYRLLEGDLQVKMKSAFWTYWI